MRPSIALKEKRSDVIALFGRFSVSNPRIFGSVLHGTDADGSDIDVLVDARPGTGLALFSLQSQLSDLLGQPVDVVTPDFLHKSIRDKVLAEAMPI